MLATINYTIMYVCEIVSPKTYKDIRKSTKKIYVFHLSLNAILTEVKVFNWYFVYLLDACLITRLSQGSSQITLIIKVIIIIYVLLFEQDPFTNHSLATLQCNCFSI